MDFPERKKKKKKKKKNSSERETFWNCWGGIICEINLKGNLDFKLQDNKIWFPSGRVILGATPWFGQRELFGLKIEENGKEEEKQSNQEGNDFWYFLSCSRWGFENDVFCLQWNVELVSMRLNVCNFKWKGSKLWNISGDLGFLVYCFRNCLQMTIKEKGGNRRCLNVKKSRKEGAKAEEFTVDSIFSFIFKVNEQTDPPWFGLSFLRSGDIERRKRKMNKMLFQGADVNQEIVDIGDEVILSEGWKDGIHRLH